MPNSTYLPRRDSDLLSFARNMAAQIAPDPALWGLSNIQHASFDALVGTFASTMATLTDPLYQSSPYVQAKNDARRELIEDANGIRTLVEIIQVQPGTTNKMRSDIAITIRRTSHTRIGPPSTRPMISITGVSGNTVHFTLRDFANPDRRGKPKGTTGARIAIWIGEHPPQDFAQWSSGPFVSRMTGSVTVPVTTAPLSRVWVAAQWINAKGQTGPYSTAEWTNLPGGVASAAA